MSGYDETCSGFEIVFKVEKKSNYVLLVPGFVFDIEIRYIITLPLQYFHEPTILSQGRRKTVRFFFYSRLMGALKIQRNLRDLSL